MEAGMWFEPGDLDAADVQALLLEHITEMRSVTPEGSSDTLDIDALKRPGLQFWVLRRGELLLACGALLELDAAHAEIKSMRSAVQFRGQGLGRLMLEQLIAEARRRKFRRISLDTGSAPFFAAARALYHSAGFVECGPFAGYREDPNKVFMTLELQPG